MNGTLDAETIEHIAATLASVMFFVRDGCYRWAHNLLDELTEDVYDTPVCDAQDRAFGLIRGARALIYFREREAFRG